MTKKRRRTFPKLPALVLPILWAVAPPAFGSPTGEETARSVGERLPAPLAARLGTTGDTGSSAFERSRLRVYGLELEDELGAEVEILLDAAGRTLLVSVEAADGETDDGEIGWSGGSPLAIGDLSPGAAETIRRFADPAAPLELEREVEWGVPVIEAEWRTGREVRELVVLEDGTFVSLGLGSVPPEERNGSLRLVAGRDELEEILIDVYHLPGLRPSHWLASGLPIAFRDDLE